MSEYHCDICNDEEYIFFTDENGDSWSRPCSCKKIRRTLLNAEKSGLGGLLNEYTFERFITDLPFQKELYDKARKYLSEDENKWFSVFGKTGAGKTMICTAICRELLERGYEVRFVNWVEDSRRLKSLVNGQEYDALIEPLKNCEVLYIDDFFKADNDTPPTNADIKLANELLNHRYNKARKADAICKTIISSERALAQIIHYDEAIAGRIAEMSDGYITLLQDDAINFRLKKYI